MSPIEQKIAREKESLHSKTVLLVNEFKNEVPQDFIYRFESIIFDFIKDLNLQIYQVEEAKVDRSEIRELIIAMDKGFEQVDKRFEDMLHYMDKRFEQVERRFEQVDKRFEDMLHYMEKRFEQLEKRFEQLEKRFEQVDKRFEDMLHYMDKRFEQVDKRFNFIQWLISLGFVVLAVLITIFQFLSK